MPLIPDASSVTRLRAIRSSTVPDPTKRSASYIPAQQRLLYSLRSTAEGRGMFPENTVLSNPIACGYVNPRHQGFITGLTSTPTVPVVMIPLASGLDFSTLFAFDYNFELILPPGPDFDAIFVSGEEPPTNIEDLVGLEIYHNSEGASGLFGNTTISTTPEWPGAIFTSDEYYPSIERAPGAFPGMSTAIQFRNVPVIENIRIEFHGPAWL